LTTQRNGIRVEGFDELSRAFVRLGEEAIPHVSDAATHGADTILAKARASAAFIDRSGDLRKSLKRNKPNKKNAYKYKIFAKVWFGKGGMHGVPVELGHKLVFMGNPTDKEVKERPFLRPAADESKDEVVDLITGAMNKALDEMGGMR